MTFPQDRPVPLCPPPGEDVRLKRPPIVTPLNSSNSHVGGQ